MFPPLLSNHNSPGSKAAAVEFSNSMYDLGSPISAGPLQVVQLAEDLKLALELQPSQEERDNLRAQLQAETAQALIEWLQSGTVSVSTLCFFFFLPVVLRPNMLPLVFTIYDKIIFGEMKYLRTNQSRLWRFVFFSGSLAAQKNITN